MKVSRENIDKKGVIKNTKCGRGTKLLATEVRGS